MSLVLVTPPDLAVTVAEAKANGRIDHSEDDALIATYIRAALAFAETYTSYPLVPQTWDLLLDAFPAGEIEIPLGPVASVTSVTYTDPSGADQTASEFEVDASPIDRAWVVPTGSWPATITTFNAVRVRFVAGRGLTDDQRQAILLLTDYFYEDRGGEKAIPFAVEAMLGLHRRMFV